MNRPSPHSFRSSLALLALGVSAGLTGCMVVPLDPQPYRTASAAPAPVLVPAAPRSLRGRSPGRRGPWSGAG
ncbi:MAG: hypothetical protein ACK520_02175 [Inhella sp.]|uniref:hypothetical protein n=1 Tax=Inhella sp. TaxID=1921806 RepID=UPI0022C334FE